VSFVIAFSALTLLVGRAARAPGM